MQTNILPITPEQANLSVKVISGPVGQLTDGWQNISYEIALMYGQKEIWRGPYKLGIAHVAVPKSEHSFNRWRTPLTKDEHNMLISWIHKPYANFLDKQLQAQVAGKLAIAQKVAPKLNDVCYSLLMDGATYFDAMSFEDFCGNFGYDTDSIKAKETFDKCDETGKQLARNLSPDILSGLREWANNY